MALSLVAAPLALVFIDKTAVRVGSPALFGVTAVIWGIVVTAPQYAKRRAAITGHAFNETAVAAVICLIATFE